MPEENVDNFTLQFPLVTTLTLTSHTEGGFMNT